MQPRKSQSRKCSAKISGNGKNAAISLGSANKKKSENRKTGKQNPQNAI